MFRRSFLFSKCGRLLLCYSWLMIVVNVSSRSILLKTIRHETRDESTVEMSTANRTSNITELTEQENSHTAKANTAIVKQSDKIGISEIKHHATKTVRSNWKSIPRNDNIYQKDDILLAQNEFGIYNDNRSYSSDISTADYSREYVLDNYTGSVVQRSVRIVRRSRDNGGRNHISTHSGTFVKKVATPIRDESIYNTRSHVYPHTSVNTDTSSNRENMKFNDSINLTDGKSNRSPNNTDADGGMSLLYSNTREQPIVLEDNASNHDSDVRIDEAQMIDNSVFYSQFDSNHSFIHTRDHGHPNHTSLHSHYDGMDDHASHGIHVASWNYAYVETPLLISLFMIIAGICKLGFHHIEILSSIVPESCVLIMLGIIVGAILHLSGQDDAFPVYMTPRLFFLFLLPPIILESAFGLHDRVFFDNIGTVLILAVIGTVLNCFLVGPSLYMLSESGGMGEFRISLVHCLVFSSLIVAVDPVAVLAIFQEVGVNNVLYFLVFGESLLNDAVTVVLYNMMKAFSSMPTIAVSQIFLGIASFFTVSFGGLFIGVLCGVMTALVTKYTNHVRVIEPLAVFVLAYLSYLFAELFHLSGIISIIACGLTQANYTFHNISQKSLTTITYFSKMQSATCDCIIFLFLGMSIFRTQLTWNTGFILWTLVLCLAFRFLVVFLLAYILNKINRLRTINLEEQFIMAYGGLRGAVCFSLVDTLDPDTLPHKELFMTSTLAVIFFTVFIQGTSIKPFVKLLRINLLETKDLSMHDEINIHVTDHVMAGIEEIMGRKGDNFWRVWLEHYDDMYLRHWLQRHPSTTDERIMEMYEKIALRQHFENLTGTQYQDVYGDSYALLDDIPSGDEASILEDGDDLNMQEHLLEQYERKRSLVPAIAAAGKRRKSRFLSPFGPGKDGNGDEEAAVASPPEPTIQDVKRIMAQTPTNLLHQHKADRNLKKDNWSNVVQLLVEKQQRTRRMSRCMSFAPITPGSPSSRGRATSTSQDRLAHMAEEDEDRIVNQISNLLVPASPKQIHDLGEKNINAGSPVPQKRRSISTFSAQDIDRIRKISRLKSKLRRSSALTDLSFEEDDMDIMELSPLVNKKAAHGYQHTISPELSPQLSPNIRDRRADTSLHHPVYDDKGETYALVNRRHKFASPRAGNTFSIATEAIPEVDWSEEEDDDDCDEEDGKEVDQEKDAIENPQEEDGKCDATDHNHEENGEKTRTGKQQQQQQHPPNAENDIPQDVSKPTILDECVIEETRR